MKEIILYHGGTDRIENPICKFGRKNLDFGQGFYLTDILEQAITWGKNIASVRNKNVIINRYKFYREEVLKNYNCKIFESYDKEWLKFIVGNRTGQNPASEFDYVEGGVANDRVIDTINLYIAVHKLHHDNCHPVCKAPDICLHIFSNQTYRNQRCILPHLHHGHPYISLWNVLQYLLPIQKVYN